MDSLQHSDDKWGEKNGSHDRYSGDFTKDLKLQKVAHNNQYFPDHTPYISQSFQICMQAHTDMSTQITINKTQLT